MALEWGVILHQCSCRKWWSTIKKNRGYGVSGIHIRFIHTDPTLMDFIHICKTIHILRKIRSHPHRTIHVFLNVFFSVHQVFMGRTRGQPHDLCWVDVKVNPDMGLGTCCERLHVENTHHWPDDFPRLGGFSRHRFKYEKAIDYPRALG